MMALRQKQSGNEAAFASASDFEQCRRLHRSFGTTYYFATRHFPPHIRRRVHALYGFVRVPDEWVDNPGSLSIAERQVLLKDYRKQLELALNGVCPEHPVLRAFADVMGECEMSLDEPILFLDAMEADLSVTRYPTYADLKGYMRGSASAVGLMMCMVLEAEITPEIETAAIALGEAMQLTNFLRDVGEDIKRERIYLPKEDLSRFGINEDEILAGYKSDRFVELMKFEIKRARSLYSNSDSGIKLLPPSAQRPVKLARLLYARILDRIEERNYDVFRARARTSTLEKLSIAARVFLGLER